MTTTAEAIQIGLSHQRAGRLADAEQIYRQVLQADPRNAAAMHLLGLIAQEVGQFQVAVEWMSNAIRHDGGQAPFHVNLGGAYRALGQVDQAKICYRQALRLSPGLAEAHNNLGALLQGQGQIEEAIASYSQAIAARPQYADAHNNLGTAYHDRGQWELAIEAYRRAAAADPRYAKAHYNLGVAFEALDRLDEASVELTRAIELEPRYAQALDALAQVCLKREDWQAAETALDRALRLRPASAETHCSLGLVRQGQGWLNDAITCFQQAVSMRPDYPEAHYHWGVVLKQQKRYDEALARFRRAIELRPDFAEAFYQTGSTLKHLARMDEAIAAHREALRIRPDFILALNDLGNVYQDLGQLDDALACYEQALEHDSTPVRPGLGEAHYNRGLVFLTQSRFADAWPEYAWRLKCKTYPIGRLSQPLWDGSSFEGRTLLVHAEQGLGDTIQFARYLPLVRQRGGRVIFAVQRRLLPLLRSSGMEGLVAMDDERGQFDLQVPLLHLPCILQTDLTTIPADVPYLTADPQLVAAWKKRLSGGDEFKVGIQWQGNRDYAQDRFRSMPLREFAPLANIKGVRLFSLQQVEGIEQIAQCADQFQVQILGPGVDEQAGPFMDTAAIMKNLDLVITCDSVVGHLAGALGARWWLALTCAADWRWMLDRDDSPWYPSQRLFRQSRLGDWSDVFAKMAGELEALVHQSRAKR